MGPSSFDAPAAVCYRNGMNPSAFFPYEPLYALKVFAEDVWIMDGPEIGMRSLGITVPFPTRMTIVRLPTGELWVHSPVRWIDALGPMLSELGPVAHLVAPNSLHYCYLGEWQARFPEARSYGVPGIDAKTKTRVSVEETLGDAPPASWQATFEQCLIVGSILTEADFFHRPSRTLIITDLIENFELKRIKSPLWRWLMKLFGPVDPDGTAPLDMRLSFYGYRQQLKAAVQRMVGWAPDRIIIAHGRCYERDGLSELKRAFRWIL